MSNFDLDWRKIIYRKDTFEVSFPRKLISRSIKVIPEQKFRNRQILINNLERNERPMESRPTNQLERSERLKESLSTWNLERCERLNGPWSTYHLERSERLKESWSTSPHERCERLNGFCIEAFLQWLIQSLWNFTKRSSSTKISKLKLRKEWPIILIS